jgi:hypothetical protein
MSDTILKVDLWQVSGFPQGTLVSSTNKTDCHEITEILLEVALNTITLTLIDSICVLHALIG